MALPTNPPSAWDRTREIWNVGQVLASRPEKFGAYARKPGEADDDWFVDVAYWMSYPDAPAVVNIKDANQVAAWLRIREDVRKGLFIAANPATKTWSPIDLTWLLVSAPKPWKAGSSWKAKRPFFGTQTRYHAGVDLAAPAGLAVLAPEAGVIVAPNSGWESSRDPKTNQIVGVKAIILRADSGRTWLLGGIRPGSSPFAAGARVSPGQKIAEVGTYPKGDSMLHVQLYDHPLTEKEVNERKSWPISASQPKYLIDPSPFLKLAMKNPKFTAVMSNPINEEIEGGEDAEGTVEGDADTATTTADPNASATSSAPVAAGGDSSLMYLAIGGAALLVGVVLLRS